MIRPLRQRHRRLVIALGIFLPVAFAAGIAARKPTPVMAALPAALAPASPKFTALAWERPGLFAKAPMQVRLWREHKDAGQFALNLVAPQDFIKPDLLVYWIPANTSVTDALPANATLLGAFAAPALPLPDEATKTNGSLILYSLADNEIVDVSKPVLLSDPTR
jgi:hypothetical protein